MTPYGYNIEWDGARWIDSDDKEFPNRMDPNRCSKCAARYVVFGRGGTLCSVCDPSDPLWETYRREAILRGRPAPVAPDPMGDLRLIDSDDEGQQQQWFDVDDLCENCEEEPVAPPQGYEREVEGQRGTLCEVCQEG